MGGRYRPGNGIFTTLLNIVYILFIVTGLFKRVIDDKERMVTVFVPVGLIAAGVCCAFGGKYLYRRLIDKYGEAQAENIDHSI